MTYASKNLYHLKTKPNTQSKTKPTNHPLPKKNQKKQNKTTPLTSDLYI